MLQENPNKLFGQSDRWGVRRLGHLLDSKPRPANSKTEAFQPLNDRPSDNMVSQTRKMYAVLSGGLEGEVRRDSRP